MSDNLAKLAELGHLKAEDYSETEFRSLLDSASKRLSDAEIKTLSSESRFDLAYNASHSLALAARLGSIPHRRRLNLIKSRRLVRVRQAPLRAGFNTETMAVSQGRTSIRTARPCCFYTISSRGAVHNSARSSPDAIPKQPRASARGALPALCLFRRDARLTL
jgi:hypothetical protein